MVHRVLLVLVLVLVLVVVVEVVVPTDLRSLTDLLY